MAVVRFNPGGSGVKFRGGWNPTVESGSTDANLQERVEQFSSHLYQGFIRHPRRETVRIIGRAELDDDGAVQITLPQGGDLVVVHRVYDAQGRFDETEPLPLSRPLP